MVALPSGQFFATNDTNFHQFLFFVSIRAIRAIRGKFLSLTLRNPKEPRPFDELSTGCGQETLPNLKYGLLS